MRKDMDMLSGNLLKKMIIFTLPIIFSSVLQLLYNAVDLAVLGKYCGDLSLDAVGSTGSLTNLIINLFIGVSIGANVAVARAIGQKDDQRVHRLVHTAVLFAVFSGIFLSIFGIFTAEIWLKLMGTNEEYLEKATLYLQIYFGGMIFNMIYNFGAAILRAVGDTRKPLYFLGIAGLANVALNFLLVLAFHMDVAGVAIGTIVSQAISAVLVMICLMKRKGSIHFSFKDICLDKSCLKEMALIGLPAGIQGTLFSISNVFIQSAVNSFDSVSVVAGNTAASNIEGFVYAAMNAFYQACITFTSQNLGAKKLSNCKKVLCYSLLCVSISGIVFGGIALIFDESLLRIYTSSLDSIAVGKKRLLIILSTYFTCGIMDVFVGGLRGLGYSIVPMIVSVMGACVFRLIWIFSAFQISHTLDTLYISYPISWVVTASVHLCCYIFVFKRTVRLYSSEDLVIS